MNNAKKKLLLDEAEKQTKAINNLKKWLRHSIGLSTITMVIAYFGIKGNGIIFTLGVIGIILTVICLAAAFLINLGIRNGKNNIEKILFAAENI